MKRSIIFDIGKNFFAGFDNIGGIMVTSAADVMGIPTIGKQLFIYKIYASRSESGYFGKGKVITRSQVLKLKIVCRYEFLSEELVPY